MQVVYRYIRKSDGHDFGLITIACNPHNFLEKESELLSCPDFTFNHASLLDILSEGQTQFVTYFSPNTLSSNLEEKAFQEVTFHYTLVYLVEGFFSVTTQLLPNKQLWLIDLYHDNQSYHYKGYEGYKKLKSWINENVVKQLESGENQ